MGKAIDNGTAVAAWRMAPLPRVTNISPRVTRPGTWGLVPGAWCQKLLRPAEEPHVYGLPENVPLHSGVYGRSGSPGVVGALDVDLRVECEELECVVVAGARGRRTRPAIHGAASADLLTAVGKHRAPGHAFGQARGRSGNTPHQPVHLVFAGLVTRHVRVAHVQDEADG